MKNDKLTIFSNVLKPNKIGFSNIYATKPGNLSGESMSYAAAGMELLNTGRQVLCKGIPKAVDSIRKAHKHAKLKPEFSEVTPTKKNK